MSHAVNAQGRGSYFYFDVIRFIAASLVVIDHLRDMAWLTWPELAHPSAVYRPVYFLTGFGASAVTVFFVLSGYWIGQSVFRRMDRERFWADYMVDRLARLWIVVLPALLLGGLCDAIGRYALHAPLHMGTSGALTLTSDIAARLGPLSALGNAAFVQTVFVDVYGSNGSLWSLSNEFWYYIWFPALLLAVRHRRVSLPLLGLGIAVAGPHLLPGFAVWLLGALLAWLDRAGPVPGRRWPVWALAPALLLFVGVTSAVRLKLVPGLDGLSEGVAFALLAWSLLRCDPRPLALAAPLARLGADSSFSLYAIHMPLMALGVALLAPGGRVAPSLPGVLALAAGYAALVLVAYAFALLTERNTGGLRTALRRRLSRQPAAPA